MSHRIHTHVAAPAGLAEWWRHHVSGSVDHVAVIEKVQDESRWSTHYLFMTMSSAGIAVLGLLLSSPAVVIGAMLISPLMGPIMGLGFGIATFDAVHLRRSAMVLFAGMLVAVVLCAGIVLLSPLNSVTPEIASRTRPNLFDLLIALFAGLAGSYAMIRGRHGTIVGVAIATAIMPPLAVVGYGLATWNTTVLTGSAFLFFTNLMTIAVTSAVVARVYGFASDLSPRQTTVQAIVILATLAALTIPLGISLQQIAWEAVASREAREALVAEFGEKASVDQIRLDFETDPIGLAATVFTPTYRVDAEQVLSRRLSSTLGHPVDVKLAQFRVAAGPREAEAKQVAAARSAPPEAPATGIAARLAVAAGVAPEAVLVDVQHRKATVRAAPLEGAALATYRALEARVAASAPEWAVTLVPPPLPLPPLTGGKDALGRENALATASWAANRLGLSIRLSGGSRAEATAVLRQLKASGTDVTREGKSRGPLSLAWAAPQSVAASAPPTP